MCEPGWRSYRRKTITTRIQDAWARRHDEQIAISPRTGFIIFTKYGTPMRPNACVNFWGKLMRKAGLEDENGKPLFPPYSLRHHCASYMLSNGVNPLSTAKHMGHSRTSMTLDVYGHFLPGDESAKEGVMLMSEKLAPRQLPPPEMPEDSRERKLTEAQVREIRAMIADGITLTRSYDTRAVRIAYRDSTTRQLQCSRLRVAGRRLHGRIGEGCERERDRFRSGSAGEH